MPFAPFCDVPPLLAVLGGKEGGKDLARVRGSEGERVLCAYKFRVCPARRAVPGEELETESGACGRSGRGLCLSFLPACSRRLAPMAAAAEAEEKAAATAAAAPSSGLSPKEEGELEDGEISDDDNPEGPPEPSSRGGGAKGPYARRRPPPDLRSSLLLVPSRRFPHLRHQPPPELAHLHGHGGGYRMKEAFRAHPPPPPPPSACSRLPPDSGPRLSFWERSHNALDRFRFRGRPYRGGGRWGRSRGGNPPGRPPGGPGGGGYGGQAWREASPRKRILAT